MADDDPLSLTRSYISVPGTIRGEQPAQEAHPSRLLARYAPAGRKAQARNEAAGTGVQPETEASSARALHPVYVAITNESQGTPPTPITTVVTLCDQ